MEQFPIAKSQINQLNRQEFGVSFWRNLEETKEDNESRLQIQEVEDHRATVQPKYRQAFTVIPLSPITNKSINR